MTYILLYSKNLPDVAAFLDLLSFFMEAEFPEQGKGEKSATFKLSVKEDEIKLKQDFEQNEIKNLIENIQQLKLENKQIKERLKNYSPKQDLKINEGLKQSITSFRKEGMSFQKIANYLNEEGFKNSRGSVLNSMLVSRLYKKSLLENG